MATTESSQCTPRPPKRRPPKRRPQMRRNLKKSKTFPTKMCQKQEIHDFSPKILKVKDRYFLNLQIEVFDQNKYLIILGIC